MPVGEGTPVGKAPGGIVKDGVLGKAIGVFVGRLVGKATGVDVGCDPPVAVKTAPPV